MSDAYVCRSSDVCLCACVLGFVDAIACMFCQHRHGQNGLIHEYREEDFNYRITCPQIDNIPVSFSVSTHYASLQRLLTYKPEERMKAREVLDHKFYWVNAEAPAQNGGHPKKRFKHAQR